MALKYLYAPSGVKAGTAYGVIPNSANADFSSFVSDTDGTRVDKNGFITDVEANVPRIDYTGGGCPSLLLEPTSTNYIEYSEDFAQSSWSKLNSTITSNTGISPDGGQNADELYFNGTFNAALREGITTTSTKIYTFSIWIKKISANYTSNDKARIEAFGSGTVGVLLLGDALNSVEVGESVRYSVTTSASTGGTSYFQFRSDEEATFEVWGSQVEPLSYASSYIPNYGTAAGVTRSQDVGGSTGDISVDIDSGEGVLFAEIAFFDIDQQGFPHMSISDGTADNRISIQKQSSTTNLVAFNVRNSNVGQCFLQESIIDKSNYFKIAGKYKQDDFALFINGNKISVDTSGSVPTGLNTFSFDKGNTFSKFFGRVRQIRIYDEVLSDNELEELTTL